MKIFYRISDNSYAKQKLPGADKETCLTNFVKAFEDVIFTKETLEGKNEPPIFIIADRCTRKTNKMLTETGLPMKITDLGNAGSLHYALDLALEECRPGELAYFVEDDYLHLGNASQVLREGMMISDYLTLYDHPDKYTNLYDMGETSKVVRTNSSHWRYTVSTCMTFAVKTDILAEDIEIFKKHTDTFETGNEGEHPLDHEIFVELREKGRKLAVSIPGVACHVDMTLSAKASRNMMEPWAIETMTRDLEEQVKSVYKRLKPEDVKRFADLESSVLKSQGWNRLIRLDALLKKCEG